MNVGSTFSGVGGFDLGFERAGMSVLWQAEIDEWCRGVLRHHWPEATIYDDVRTVGRSAAPVDLLCGGFPCQDLSVAGKRAGFKGERSSLFFEFARIADELRPRWIVLENVVGLLSSANGRDFGILLATLAEIGYIDLCWRVVDARYFGVPQRRRRVFIVGYLGDNGERAVRALGAGGEGNLAAGNCAWQDAAAGTSGGAGSAGGVIANTLQVTCGDYSRADGFNAVVEPAPVTSAFYSTGGSQSGFARTDGVSPTLKVGSGLDIASPVAVSFSENQQGALRESDVAAQLTTGGGKPGQGYPAVRIERPIVAPTLTAANNPSRSPQSAEVTQQIEAVHRATVSFQLGNTKANGSNVNTEGVAYTLDRAAGQGVLTNTLGSDVSKPLLAGGGGGMRTTDLDGGAYVGHRGSSVRRLTPTECERLMGWPDGWTAVDGDKTPDGRRYAACGNGVVANVSEWIGRRIMAIDRLDNK